MKLLFIPLILIVISACGQEIISDNSTSTDSTKIEILKTSGKIIETRFNTPKSFTRVEVDSNSFAEYLRNLQLKPDGANVKLFNGAIKSNYDVYCAVVDLEIGKKNLHQCADAIMRLRAEYLWNNGQYNQIHFNFTNGFRVDYSEWMKGNRIGINGNKTYWVSKYGPSNTYKDFWSYMEIIFSYAGTLSLSKEMKSKGVDDLQIGDVFIQGGSPGHAVIVVDKAINSETGEVLFMLAQSYMPAQELQILSNPNDENISPWYTVNENGILYTPEWTFNYSDLKGF